ncbi:development-specific protein LVN1.2-like [Asterias amurensis]|uniref:development-specific protein LVN1.2-like n=1 Tax=Asterias amurensis TaxID=7602 RepID=UPI003AB3F269
MKNFAAVCLILLAAVNAPRSAEAQKRCECGPERFEARIGQLNGLVYNGTAIAQLNNIEGAIDFTQGRTGLEIHSYQMNYVTKLKIITDVKGNYTYTIMGGACTKTPAMSIGSACLPKEASFAGTYYFGDRELYLDSFSYYGGEKGTIEGNYSVSVAQDSCVPVSVTIYGKTLQEPSLPIVSNSGYTEFRYGIRDPERWFDVPDICKKVALKGVKEASRNDKSGVKLASLIHSLIKPTH